MSLQLTPMKSQRPYALLAVVIILWGVNFIVSRILTGLSPVRVSGVYYALFRYLLGALTMITVLLIQRRSYTELKENLQPHYKMLGMSGVLSAIFVLAIHTSTEYISSGSTSILVNLSPIVVLVFCVAFTGERLTSRKIIGFVLGLFGALIFLYNSSLMGSDVVIGITLAIVGMFAWGFYTITLQYLEGADMYFVMTVNHVVSTLMIVPFLLLLFLEGVPLIFVLDMWSGLGLLFAGVLASGLAYVLYFAAIETIGASRASSFLFLIPFVSVLGDFILGEPPAFVLLLAGLIAILGVAIVRSSED